MLGPFCIPTVLTLDGNCGEFQENGNLLRTAQNRKTVTEGNRQQQQQQQTLHNQIINNYIYIYILSFIKYIVISLVVIFKDFNIIAVYF